MESGVPLTIGIQNPSSTDKDWNTVARIRNPLRGIQNPKPLGFPYMGRGIEYELLNKLNELAQLSIKHRVEVIKSVVFCWLLICLVSFRCSCKVIQGSLGFWNPGR